MRLFFFQISILFFQGCNSNSKLTPPKNFGVDFDQAMAAPSYDKKFASQNKEWRMVKSLYYDYMNNLDISPNTRIPKIIHQVWIGSPLPQKYKSLIESWKRYHPDWLHILWTDKELDELGLINKKLYDAATNMGEKSDIAKYELVYRFGGLYVDTDFECLMPFDILNHSCDFYTGVGPDRELHIYAALFAAVPGHPILKKCVERLGEIKKNVTSPDAILFNTGPYFITRCAVECLESLKNAVFFPVTYFYPWPGLHRHQNTRAEIDKWVRPESFGVHHWHCSWQKGTQNFVAPYKK